ncbi:MAG: hypothetical protein IJ702_09745, partial [Fretibacterium sp.]|nr:hypothetical protein [Fretibacterium sp.]
MRQFNFEYPSLEAALSGLADIRNVLESEKAAGRCSDALLLVFTTCLDNEEMGKFLRALDNALPGVKRAGISETPRERYVKLNLMTAERSSFHAAQFPCEPGQEAETAAAFSDFLNGIEDARGVGLFPSGKTLNVTEFLEAAFAEREDLPVFGALANGMFKLSQPISRYEPEREALSGIGVELLDSGFTVVVFSGRELAVYADYILGWHPIGREFKFKPGDKPPYGETAIEEIDGRPAVELYKKYLGVEWSGEFTWNVCEFPLMVRRNGADVCLVPLVQDRSGEIYFSGTVREGERLRLSYGTRNDILGSSYDGSQRMRRFAPEAVFLSLCGNRLIYLRDEAHLEWDFYREHFPELVYCHGYSEVYYHGGKGGVLNSSFIAVGFREGPGPSATFEPLKCGKHRDGRYSECPECEACTRRNECKAGTERLPLSNDGVIPLPYRMSHFLQVMTGELEEMTEKAEAANRAKSAFLSSMSHEIRTPINAVLGMDEMILREATEKNILEYAGNIRTAGNSLLGLINDILDFSKIEAGKMELIPVEYEMASVLNDLANMISKRAEDKGLKLIVEAAQDIPSSLRGDELRLKQAVINILTNAVKYTQQGSVTFRVGCERDGGDAAILSFSVTDTGIGIKEEDMSRLFSPFERLDEGRNHSVEGTGLGMAITTQILSKMGSKLEVQSVYGEGSTFSFKVRQEIVNPEPMGDFQEVFRRSLAKRAEYHESFWAPDARVLAVDDMFINLAVFRGLLKRTKVRVDT